MKKLQQPHNSTSTVAFFARGREIGFVILENGKIVRYGVKTIRGQKQGPDLIRRVEHTLAPVLAMAGSHSVLVIERDADLSRKGTLCRTVHRLSEQWRRRGYRVLSVPWKEVKEKLCERNRATQREITRAVVQRHTLLWPLVRRSTVQAGYWKKVLLAAALADVAQQR